jgi:hypothetical protein
MLALGAAVYMILNVQNQQLHIVAAGLAAAAVLAVEEVIKTAISPT